jgi:DNA (cytosine-5)-methyltransferase 1
MLTVGSTFTGVGGADLGLERAGFSVAWQCELDAWKRSVLAAHWPSVPIHEDITTLHHPPSVDLLIGGFPCQDLSVAGKRKGFSGERSVLAFEFLRLAESLRPRWLLLENVPGLLSSNRGRDLARLLDEVGTIGYGWALRVLDARYFGVPQRRRRVFICARRADTLNDSRSASELALRALWEGSGGDSTPGWPPREITARAATGRARASSEQQVTQDLQDDLPIGFYPTGGSQQGFAKWDGLSPALKAADGPTAIAFRKSRRAASNTDDETWVDDGFANTLNTFDVGDNRTTHAIANGMTVRRLTPVECERLMGWPDGWTAPVGVKAPDSNRYAACGDGIVSWVAYWIGQRIRMIEEES